MLFIKLFYSDKQIKVEQSSKNIKDDDFYLFLLNQFDGNELTIIEDHVSDRVIFLPKSRKLVENNLIFWEQELR